MEHRTRLIDAIADRDRKALLDLLAGSAERKTIYYFVGKAGSEEVIHKTEDSNGQTKLLWNYQGRVYDEGGNIHRLGDFKGWRSVGRVGSVELRDLPFNFEGDAPKPWMLKSEIVNTNI